MAPSEQADIILYTAPTPNGYKASIHFEELKAKGKLDYTVKPISFQANEQKSEWFLKINPNGRIPAITDKGRNNFNVFESAAILLYLSQHYDKDHEFWFDPATEPDLYSEMLQWIFFTHGGIGPMQGQANHFYRYAPEKIPYGINRYITETKRLYSVLEGRLSNGREYLVGADKGKYSIADINCFPWVRGHAWAGVDNFDNDFPNVKAWIERINARPGVYEGLGVPTRNKANKTAEEIKEEEDKAREWIMRK